jgi:regulator of replication initiation timing
MLKILTLKEFKRMQEELQALNRLHKIIEEMNEKNVKLEEEKAALQEELEEEKNKHQKEAVKKKNMRIAATKKWLNGYPDE